MKANKLPEGRSSRQKSNLVDNRCLRLRCSLSDDCSGESLGSIAKQTIINPVGSLVSEVKNSV
jgi:hypothetical protein